MEYTLNWNWECMGDVFFNDESHAQAEVRTNDKGKIKYARIPNVSGWFVVNDSNLDYYKIASIHYTNPAMVKRR